MARRAQDRKSEAILYGPPFLTKPLLYLELGKVSRISGDDYKFIAIDDSTNEYKPGEILKLNNTHYREVIKTGKTVALIEYEKEHG